VAMKTAFPNMQRSPVLSEWTLVKGSEDGKVLLHDEL
jgi:hypothetical protein